MTVPDDVCSQTDAVQTQDVVTAKDNSNDSFSQLVSSIRLDEIEKVEEEEEEAESTRINNGDHEDVEETMEDEDVLEIENLFSPIADASDDEEEWQATNENEVDRDTASKRVANDHLTYTVHPDQVFVLDMQMVYHRGRGSLIKEMAYRLWNKNLVYGINIRHDVADVPSHLTVKHKGRVYDVHSGLDLEAGEYVYDDRIIAHLLNDARIVILKGANKKTTLTNVYGRLLNGIRPANDDVDGGDVSVVYTKPIIINVDGHTADDEDRRFCKDNALSLAAFSFPFVYTNMDLYAKMLYEMPDRVEYSPTDVLYITNVLSKDARFVLSGRGRVVCICHSDHSSGGTNSSFGQNQRCSLLNLSILDTLWSRKHDAVFRNLVRTERNKEQKCLQNKRKHRYYAWNQPSYGCYQGRNNNNNNNMNYGKQHYRHRPYQYRVNAYDEQNRKRDREQHTHLEQANKRNLIGVNYNDEVENVDRYWIRSDESHVDMDRQRPVEPHYYEEVIDEKKHHYDYDNERLGEMLENTPDLKCPQAFLDHYGSYQQRTYTPVVRDAIHRRRSVKERTRVNDRQYKTRGLKTNERKFYGARCARIDESNDVRNRPYNR